jgi:hypothetical protein
MKSQRIPLPPYQKWSKSFKKVFFQRLGGWNSIKSEDDMEFAEEIALVIRDGMCLVEIKWYQDTVEMLPKDLPPSIRKKITK